MDVFRRSSGSTYSPLVWAADTQHMKDNYLPSRPSVSSRRLSPELEAMAAALARFFFEFGIGYDSFFGERAAALAFINGTSLGAPYPEAAARLEADLATHVTLPARAIERMVADIASLLLVEASWGQRLRQYLVEIWDALGAESVADDPVLGIHLRILMAVRIGIRFAQSQRESNRKLARLWGNMTREIQFMTTRLAYWEPNNLRPRHASFVEFATYCSHDRPVVQQVISSAIGELAPFIRDRPEPWDVDYWVKAGWARAREFAQSSPDLCRRLLQEVPGDELRLYRKLYEDLVLGLAGPGGEIRLFEATRRYFAITHEGFYERLHCAGEQPRLLAWTAFDFNFWMGVFSTFPLPVAIAEPTTILPEGA